MSGTETRHVRGLRVPVAEDELLIARLIREILLSLECTVIGPVGNLDDALRAIRLNDFDAALLDVQLGKESIHPAINELVQRGIPFILVTGQGNLSGSSAVLGNAPILAKPFRVRQLEHMMSITFRARDGGEPDRR